MDMHAHRDEGQFRLAARRNRLVGLWAAQRLGKTGVAADEYAKEVMYADLMEPGDDDISPSFASTSKCMASIFQSRRITAKLR